MTRLEAIERFTKIWQGKGSGAIMGIGFINRARAEIPWMLERIKELRECVVEAHNGDASYEDKLDRARDAIVNVDEEVPTNPLAPIASRS